MKKLLYILILFLLPILGYSQSGEGYINYKSYKTHYGNAQSSTDGNVTYTGIADNITELVATLDVNQPGTTLYRSGETVATTMSSYMTSLPKWNGERYGFRFEGWIQAQETGTYSFGLQSDDASAFYLDDDLKLFRPCCGTSYVNVSLTSGQWYKLEVLFQEYTGGDYMYFLYSPPSSASYWYVGGNTSHLKLTNIEPTYPHKLDVTYNLNSTLDKSKFNSYIVYTDLGTATTIKVLPTNGVVSYDSNGNGLDETLYPNGNYKSTTTGGSVEWCVVYNPLVTNQYRYRVGIDKREFPSGFDFTKLTQLQLFDVWDGSVTYKSDDQYWAEYYIYTSTALDFTNSTFSTNIRAMSYGNYALQAEFSFEDITGFTTHKVKLDMDETYFTTTYPDMITIADIAKGFSQLTNQTDTPNGPQGGIFTSDVEFILGDVNGDNSFDFLDTQMLLQHLFAETSPFSTKTIDNTLLMFDGGYTNSITTNWSSNKPTTRLFTHVLDEDNKEQTKSIDVAFIGDLNLSHSSALQSVNVSAKVSPRIMLSKNGTDNTMILDVVKENDILKVTLEIPQNQNNITGTQFKLYYDEDRLEFQDSNHSSTISSFTSKRNGYINIGSFSADGSTNLNNGIIYTLNFKLKSDLQSTLGLVSLGFSELVDKDGNQINYIVR